MTHKSTYPNTLDYWTSGSNLQSWTPSSSRHNSYSGPSLLNNSRPKLTTTVWEDEGTICYQVDANGVCVARRQDNDMINGTKLLNVVGMSRGKRDGILKNEKGRVVIKIGAMHLKGVWITFSRAKELAVKFKIEDILYPLFVDDPSVFLTTPSNYNRSSWEKNYSHSYQSSLPSITNSQDHSFIIRSQQQNGSCSPIPNTTTTTTTATTTSIEENDIHRLHFIHQPYNNNLYEAPYTTATVSNTTQQRKLSQPQMILPTENNKIHFPTSPPPEHNSRNKYESLSSLVKNNTTSSSRNKSSPPLLAEKDQEILVPQPQKRGRKRESHEMNTQIHKRIKK